MMNSVMAADTYFPITYKVNIFEKVFDIASVIWIIVFLAIVTPPDSIPAVDCQIPCILRFLGV